MAGNRGWEGFTFRPLEASGRDARDLFSFVGAWVPPEAAVETGWAAWSGSRLVGAVLLERAGAAAMLHGPVALAPEAAGSSPDALEVAARLLEEVLEHASGRGIETLFTRPQALDRVWVRLGFIPVPEGALPEALRGRPGTGLFAWRGGSALWSAAGRGAARSGSPSER